MVFLIKRRRCQITFLAVIAVLAMLSLTVCGCGSVGTDKLLAVADKGLAAVEKNDELLIEALRRQIHNEIKTINAGVDRDAELVAADQLKYADGTTVKLDAAWIKEMRQGYFVLLESKYKQLRELDRTQDKIQGNLKTIRELIERSRELNTGYIESFQGVQNMLDQADVKTLENLSKSN